MKKYGVPTIFAIFGVTGDLAQRKIFPALMDLYAKKLLPERFAVVGISRRDLSDEDFREYVKGTIKKEYPSDDVDSFVSNFRYQQGQFDDGTTYEKTQEVLEKIDEEWGQCSNKLFYLAVPPSLYELILMNVSKTKLSEPCSDETGWTRILIEKPFGKDVETAQKLDALLGKLFKEEQIYRIDHYLKKQTLQNILIFRFSNSIFEPIWDRKNIKAVEINLFEKDTVKDRGAFYDANGALRDVGQNHILQMLALIAMEKPKEMNCTFVRKAREEVLRRLRKYSRKDYKTYMLRAQYEGYLETEGVSSDSDTETFFSLVAFIKNKRWRDVPFYLTSGKGLSESKVEIMVHFNGGNKLTFNIQPDEKISILFWAKKSGFVNEVEPKELSFSFHDENNDHIDAYEKVLFDCIKGDQTSFISTSEVLSAWDYIMSVRDIIENAELEKYSIGSSAEEIKKLKPNLKKI